MSSTEKKTFDKNPNQKQKNMQNEFMGLVSFEEKKKILKYRANQLKIAPVIREEGRWLYGIEFLLGEERYFIESKNVVEVAHLKELTTLPGTPAFILGVFNLRGKILAVISIKKFFNLSENAITNHNRVIIVKHQEIELGILTDEIVGTNKINTAKIQSNIAGIAEGQNDFLSGVTNEGIMVIDIEQFLLDSRITIN